MSAKQRAPLLDDQPSEHDHLDFEPYRETLRGIIGDQHTHTPLTVGVFGTWGTGKTTLLQMVMRDVQDSHLTVWFNAWKYDKEDALWRALLLRTVATVREAIPEDTEEAQSDLRDLEDTLYQAIEREELGNFEFDWREFLKGATETGVQVAMTAVPGLNLAAKVVEAVGKSAGEKGPGRLLQAFQRARTQVRMAQMQSLEQFEKRFADLIERYIMPRRLVVFVDDLDRCLPQKAIEVLEAIKLFLDVPGCIFVLGIDRDVITRGIRIKYRDLAGEIEGGKYLEKIIQLPFELPPLEAEDVHTYVRALTPNLPDPRCEEIFASGLTEPNPRQIKRTINTFLFLSRLADARAERLGRLQDVRLAKVVVIQHSHQQLYSLLRREPRLLAELETYYRALEERGEERLTEEPESLPPLPDRLQPFASSEALHRLLTLCADQDEACFAKLTPLDIRPYFTLVRGVTVAEPEAAPRAVFEPQTVPVPEGEFLMGTSYEEIDRLVENTDWAWEWQQEERFANEQPQHAVFLDGYEMGRYPVTNLEYQAFVEATGYYLPPHWNGPAPPDEIADHPVVNVSHDDALAYCEWLAEESGRPYRLPTEAEWEKAARGTDARIYPWGDTFDAALCNTKEGGPGGTTPVGQYSPGGDSPYGCADMAGNAWEWCLDRYAADCYRHAPRENPAGPEAGDERVVRGGSWGNTQEGTRCACRDGIPPSISVPIFGFRVVAAPPVSQGN